MIRSLALLTVALSASCGTRTLSLGTLDGGAGGGGELTGGGSGGAGAGGSSGGGGGSSGGGGGGCMAGTPCGACGAMLECTGGVPSCPSKINRCGGCKDIPTYVEGNPYAQIPGQSCGSGHIYYCATSESLNCTPPGAGPANACGRSGTLPHAIGERCGPTVDCRYTCARETDGGMKCECDEIIEVDDGGYRGDRVRPALSLVSWDTQLLDTSMGPATANLTLHVTDDLSGVVAVNAHFTSLFGDYFNVHALDASVLDGSVVLPFSLPVHSPQTQWRLSSIFVDDGAGNRGGTNEVPAAFRIVQQTGAGDGLAPRWLSLDASVEWVDTSTGDVPVELSALVTDDVAGVRVVEVRLDGPGGVSLGPVTLTLDAGTPLAGVYRGVALMPRGARTGTWRVAPARCADSAGNAGFSPPPVVIITQVADGGDASPPGIVSAAVSPNPVDAFGGPVVVTVDLRLVDDLSGVDVVTVFAEQPALVNAPYAAPIEAQASLVSGDARDGGWRATFTVPRYARTGRWKIWVDNPRDRSGNTLYFNGTETPLLLEVR